MSFAGFAEAARGLLIAVPVLASILAGGPALAQDEAALRWYTEGLRALDARRFEEARTLLQRAVEADPSFAGAWLDLAIAANAAGDPVAAEEFLSILEARFSVPVPIARRVADLRAAIERQRQVAERIWRWSGSVSAAAGYDTNANAGLAHPDLTLTFPGGPVVLPIADAQRPRQDGYVATSILAEGSRLADGGQFEGAASVRARANGHLRAYDTVDFQAALAFVGAAPAFRGRIPFAAGPWRVGTTVQRLWLGRSTLLQSVSVSALHAWPSVRCTPQAGVEASARHFPVAYNLDSRLLWLSASGTCDNRWAGPGARVTAQLRAGYEAARGDFTTAGGRPGDDTRHLEATVVQRWAWDSREGTHRLEAQAQWARAADTRGYSPLLANNAARRVDRWTAALSYTLPVPHTAFWGAGWTASATIQAFRQRSNLELFRLQGEVFQLGMQRSW